MQIIEGICYPDTPAQLLEVEAVQPRENYTLAMVFNNGDRRLFDFTPLLTLAAFAPLKDKKLFDSVYVDYGTAVWNDGEIDIAPETLYHNGVPIPQ